MLQIHVILSLVGILTGFVVLYGLVTGVSSGGWTAIFLATTILTSVTGFPLSPFGFDPPRAVGVISLVCWRWLSAHSTPSDSRAAFVALGVVAAMRFHPAIEART
jgi:hypothetical protein